MANLSVFNIPQIVGFDRMFEEFERLTSKTDNYPPFNVKTFGDGNNFLVEIACAGFKRDEISVVTKGNYLIISGEKKPPTDTNFKIIHQGIGMRSFRQTFPVADDVRAISSSYVDGILSIHLVREAPEEPPVKAIPIQDSLNLITPITPKALTK